MPDTKPTIAARVPQWLNDWIEREVARRDDRDKSYVINELLREEIERREQESDERVPA